MTNEQIEEARELREQGYSLRDIETKLKVSKSAVDRALKDDETTISGVPGPTVGKRHATTESFELGRLDLTSSHQRGMAELEIKQEELALQRRQTELDAERAGNDKQLLRIREQQFEKEQQAEADRLVSRKEMLTGKFNRLVRELLKNCEDANWSEHEVDEYLGRVKDLKTKIGRFCDKHVIDEDELAIWHHAAALSKLIEQTKEDNTAWFGSDVSFDFEKKQVQQVKRWLIEDFDDAYVKPAKKGSTDEEDQDADEDDEEGLSGFEREKELVGTFNELIAELVDNCENADWTRADYNEYITRIEAFQEELTGHVDTLDKHFDADQQAITVNTEELLDFVIERYAIVKETGNVLTLYVNVDSKEWLNTLPVDDFWEKIEQEEEDEPAQKFTK